MARKLNTDMLTSYAEKPAPEEVQEKKTNVNQNSLDNLQPNHRQKTPTTYMQVNVYGYEDYLYRMARYHKQTTTKYVLSLIRQDAEKHAEDYDHLKELEEYNKPHRESPNRKRS